MMASDKKLLLTYMQGQLDEDGFVTNLRLEKDVYILRVIVPLREDRSGQVIMEIAVLDYNGYTDLIQIYTGMLEVPEESFAPLQAAFVEWNLTATAGAYGIYTPTRQLYHKYNVPIYADMNLEDKADMAFLGACLAMDEMGDRLEEAMELSGGVLYKVD